jgi:hypothetical protein
LAKNISILDLFHRIAIRYFWTITYHYFFKATTLPTYLPTYILAGFDLTVSSVSGGDNTAM